MIVPTLCVGTIKPARECGGSVTEVSTGGLLSRAGSLPLLMRFIQLRMWCLGWRHREQAHSYKGIGLRLEPFVAFVEGLLDEVGEGLDFGGVLRVGVDGEPSMELHRFGE